ncbi:hypothetical protein PR048_016968 [Dryococelus australis]|uniref:Uncharacterized protein n=1 Tax=Dryococelus australis TaxID=614101 RepID=A0ABQ9H882_9NEOP|nr:hypothetical protein PR048_016968 [Dryococelus australis]
MSLIISCKKTPHGGTVRERDELPNLQRPLERSQLWHLQGGAWRSSAGMFYNFIRVIDSLKDKPATRILEALIAIKSRQFCSIPLTDNTKILPLTSNNYCLLNQIT